MSKHTQGEWEVASRQHASLCSPSIEVRAKDTGRVICDMGDYPTDEDRANARFIASAPKLLEALEDLVGLAKGAMRDANCDWAGYDVDEDLAEARALVAEARKETQT